MILIERSSIARLLKIVVSSCLFPRRKSEWTGWRVCSLPSVDTGIITNADREICYLIEKLDVKPFLDIIITLEGVRAEKPAARIFLVALDKSKVKASEMIYVGDQYETDILGAECVGIKALLIDRYDVDSNIPGCLRIGALTEIFSYL
jgi:FMN phosphatase YigB (HAD superfamily)